MRFIVGKTSALVGRAKRDAKTTQCAVLLYVIIMIARKKRKTLKTCVFVRLRCIMGDIFSDAGVLDALMCVYIIIAMHG